MRAYEIIRKKRDGLELAEEEIAFFVRGAASGEMPDYQVSALLMAICIKGMSMAETVAMTKAMLASGAAFDFSGLQGVKIDKHSTGGVGDKTSIILAPLMASMGVRVPMIAGRGLGHTGGTLDKLESIPGFRTNLNEQEAMKCLDDVGAFIMGQTASIAPADKKLYALRDVTATVESIPLIASSIMSKKLAEGIGGLVLDVKTGSGAFMQKVEDARVLAKAMVDIGNALGVRTVALVTDMDQPLGRCVGNTLEIKECISAIRGKGAPDLMEVTYALMGWMLNITDSLADEVPMKPMSDFIASKYKHEAMEFIERGDAFKKLAEIVDAQGGNADAIFNQSLLPVASNITEFKADRDGYIRKLDARAVGEAAMMLGAGRSKADDAIDHAAGIIFNRKKAEKVEKGQPIALIHHNNPPGLQDAMARLSEGIEIGDRDPVRRPLVIDVVK